MYQSLLLLLAFSSACASTIATVSCEGTVVSGTSSVQCSSALSSAFAKVDAPFLVVANAQGIGYATAAASFSATYLFMVTAGPSAGFYLPCIGAGIHPLASASGSFGRYSIEGIFPGANICTFGGLASASPFIADVGQQFVISMSASARGFQGANPNGTAEVDLGASFRPFKFWDSNGNALTNVSYTLTLVPTEVPEPSNISYFFFAWLLLGTVIVLSLVSTRSGKRKFRAFIMR